MKEKKGFIFIIISSIALLLLLLIQVIWILETARIKEILFSENANMVLSKTANALAADKETCMQIGACLDSAQDAKLGKIEMQKIDSLFQHFMKEYNLKIDYSFSIMQPQLGSIDDPFGINHNSVLKQEGSYQKNVTDFNWQLEDIDSNDYKKRIESLVREKGIELKLVFPDKKHFIIAEMGKLFVASVCLVFIVLLMFWRTTFSLIKEKKIANQTTDFLNNMTHEFKTPLTNIALATKMILKNTSLLLNTKMNHYLTIILQENEKLQTHVEQILSMTALEKGEIPMQHLAIDVNKLIEKAVHAIGVQIEMKNGHLQLHLQAQNAMVIGDETHLANAFCNLIDNAIKYANQTPHIIIETLNINQGILICCKDNGIGIKKEFQHKVFEKYYRVSHGDVHNTKGFGLGLTYVKKIIELHAGVISLESELDKGTTIKIFLPNASSKN
jgi:two-component system, OmpR family, phosphate regulon sensor histidine kinase PhoR